MIIPINKKMSSAVGAKTARACDYCISKRARWYCAADDAFLCQACDSSVHSANSLARRHERVRLKAASSSLKLPKLIIHPANPSVPSWHRGLTRKARTPRHGKHAAGQYRHQTASDAKSDDITQQYPLHPLVPELGADDSYSLDGNEEEQLLYRVPVYDPFVAEFHVSTPISNEATPPTDAAAAELTAKPDQTKAPELLSPHIDHRDDINYCFLPSEMDLAEFAADVETLLGKGLDQETYTIDELGLLDDDVREENSATIFEDYNSMNTRLPSGSVVKAEGNNREAVTMAACHAETEPFELSFDYDEDPPTTCEEKDANAVIAGGQAESLAKEEQHIELAARSLHRDDDRDEEEEKKKKKKKGKKISLRLDYEAIRAAWGGQGSPWMNGERPAEIDPDDGWPHGTGSCGAEVHQQPYGPAGMGTFGGGGEQGSTAGGGGDGGREARVSRYREKRRTRLFSKKIRYEVRKLNAEKRPRMKGRFVKRSSFAPAGIPIMGK